jgi:hypothetical protein
MDALLKAGVDEQTATDWLQHRKKKKASFSVTVMNDRAKQAGIAGISLSDALAMEVSRGWQGFDATWILPKQTRGAFNSPTGNQNKQEALEQRNQQVADRLAAGATT